MINKIRAHTAAFLVTLSFFIVGQSIAFAAGNEERSETPPSDSEPANYVLPFLRPMNAPVYSIETQFDTLMEQTHADLKDAFNLGQSVLEYRQGINELMFGNSKEGVKLLQDLNRAYVKNTGQEPSAASEAEIRTEEKFMISLWEYFENQIDAFINTSEKINPENAQEWLDQLNGFLSHLGQALLEIEAKIREHIAQVGIPLEASPGCIPAVFTDATAAAKTNPLNAGLEITLNYIDSQREIAPSKMTLLDIFEAQTGAVSRYYIDQSDLVLVKLMESKSQIERLIRLFSHNSQLWKNALREKALDRRSAIWEKSSVKFDGIFKIYSRMLATKVRREAKRGKTLKQEGISQAIQAELSNAITAIPVELSQSKKKPKKKKKKAATQKAEVTEIQEVTGSQETQEDTYEEVQETPSVASKMNRKAERKIIQAGIYRRAVRLREGAGAGAVPEDVRLFDQPIRLGDTDFHTYQGLMNRSSGAPVPSWRKFIHLMSRIFKQTGGYHDPSLNGSAEAFYVGDLHFQVHHPESDGEKIPIAYVEHFIKPGLKRVGLGTAHVVLDDGAGVK